jgi:hypothetical protein
MTFTQEPYSLEIISKHSKSDGQSFKQHLIDGHSTIGVLKNEPFEILFTNHTAERVQCRLSFDGIDLLTGEPASTSGTGKMWLVNRYGTLRLKAWPETSSGGAQFIFTSAEKSVALHTSGDLSNRGIIACAVYREGYKPSYSDKWYYQGGGDVCKGVSEPYWKNLGRSDLRLGDNTKGARSHIVEEKCSFNAQDFGKQELNEIDDGGVMPAAAGASMDFMADCERSIEPVGNRRARKSLESLAAIGAGEQVKQSITTAAGLTMPQLHSVIQIKYLWYKELVKRAKEIDWAPAANGFPADEKQIMSLGSTPRVETEERPFRRTKFAELTRF